MPAMLKISEKLFNAVKVILDLINKAIDMMPDISPQAAANIIGGAISPLATAMVAMLDLMNGQNAADEAAGEMASWNGFVNGNWNTFAGAVPPATNPMAPAPGSAIAVP
jgi:hypothetical protein